MKSITVSLLTLIMCFASQANAETTSERSNSMPLANTLQQIEQRLQLSEQQKQKAFPVFKKAQKQRQQVFKEYGIGLGTKPDLSLWQKISLGKSMKKVQAQADEELEEILSQQQMALLNEMRDETRAKMKSYLEQ